MVRRLTKPFFSNTPREVRIRVGSRTFPFVLIPRDHRAIMMGIYEQPVVQVLEILLSPGMVAVDGGAHIGFFTILMAHLVRPGGRVIAFEIHPDLLSLLEKNVSLAPEDTEIEIRPQALADQPGQRLIQLQEGGCTSLKALGDHPVTLTTLDHMFREGRVDLVKLDVEGLEAHVLEGGRGVLERCQPALVLELHEPLETFVRKSIVRDLLEHGYRFFLLSSSPPELPHLIGLPPRFAHLQDKIPGKPL